MSIELTAELGAWLSRRKEAMFARPQMFGSQAEFECQFLLVLEMELKLHHPALEKKNPRYILDKWIKHCASKFGSGVLPAHSHKLEWEEFMNHVKAFQRHINIAAVEDDFEAQQK